MIMADSHCHMAETNPTLQKKKKRQPNFFSIACIKNLNSVIKKFCSVMQKRMEGMPKNYLLANIEQQPPLPRKPGSGVE